jgi:hypothetical protein
MAAPGHGPHDVSGVTQQQKGGLSMLTADQIKAKFRNFPEAELRRRIAEARLV